MAAVNPTATWTPTNYTTQTGTSYPLAIDGNFAVSTRFIDNFAPRAAVPPNMTVLVDPGHLFTPSGPTLTEIGGQISTVFTAPSLLPRIDRVVADQNTGAISVVAGTENASPVAPAITPSKMPICQVLLQPGMLAITGSQISDERALWGIGTGGGFTTQASVASSTTTDLGATGSNNVFISGNTTISSFGSSASTTTPIYVLTFAGALTLTESAHLLLPGGTSQITAANDSLLANYLGAGNWQVLAYFSASNPTVPTGAMLAYAGSAAPSGYLLCQGQAVSTTTFANLFGVIGYTYGGSGANFFIPDSRGRVLAGVDPGNATGRLTAASSGGVSAAAAGNAGGEQSHTQTGAEQVPHTHGVPAETVSITGGGVSVSISGGQGIVLGSEDQRFQTGGIPYDAVTIVDGGGVSRYFPSNLSGTGTSGALSGTSSGGTTGSAGGGAAANVSQPTLIVTRIIKI